MNQIQLFNIILQDTFKLKSKPFVVRRGRIMWPGKIPCWGMYSGEMIKNKFRHKIEYYYKTNPKTIFSILAHEYVHAWQMENNLELEHSKQKEFRVWLRYFRRYYGVDIEGIV